MLFTEQYVKQEDSALAYNRLAAEHGIFAAEINSIRKETEAIYSSWKELLVVRVQEQEEKVHRLETKLKGTLSPGKAHQGRRKLHRYQIKLVRLRAELAGGIPKLCFGSKALFHKQFHLADNGYRDHANWRKE